MRNNLKVVSLRVNRSFMRNFVYVVGNPLKRTAILLDPAFDHMAIERVLEQNSWTLEAVLTTHHHVDHMDLTNYYAQNFQVPIYMSQPEASFYNIGCTNLTCFKSDSLLSLQTADVHILNTPGHTFGASCYLIDNHLFTGDTVFIEGCGICLEEGASAIDLFYSFQKIKRHVNPDTRVYPGHCFGKEPGQTIDYLSRNNIYYCFERPDDFAKFRNRRNQPDIFAFK